MKFLYTIAFSLFFYFISAQDMLQKNESVAAVPDAPAFHALSVTPNTLLRPSDVRTIAAFISPFIENGRFVLPRGFALEVSPGALIYRDRYISVEDYKKRNINLAYNTGISIGTKVLPSGLNSLSIGWRTTFINKADKFLDAEFQRNVNNTIRDFYMSEEEDSRETAWNLFQKRKFQKFAEPDKARNMEITITEAKKGRDSVLVGQFFNEFPQTSDKLEKQIRKMTKEWESKNWNAMRLDIGAAFVAVATDTTSQNIKADRIQAWLSFSHPAGKNGQILVGAHGRAGFEEKPKDAEGNVLNPEYEFGLSGRIYAGVNKYKFFADVMAGYKQGGRIKRSASNHLMIGTEIGIYNLVWLNLYGGFRDIAVKVNGKNVGRGFVQFDWKFTIPDWALFRK